MEFQTIQHTRGNAFRVRLRAVQSVYSTRMAGAKDKYITQRVLSDCLTQIKQGNPTKLINHTFLCVRVPSLM
jgi:hypothetical protein